MISHRFGCVGFSAAVAVDVGVGVGVVCVSFLLRFLFDLCTCYDRCNRYDDGIDTFTHFQSIRTVSHARNFRFCFVFALFIYTFTNVLNYFHVHVSDEVFFFF